LVYGWSARDGSSQQRRCLHPTAMAAPWGHWQAQRSWLTPMKVHGSTKFLEKSDAAVLG
jgi:hypothetical protein